MSLRQCEDLYLAFIDWNFNNLRTSCRHPEDLKTAVVDEVNGTELKANFFFDIFLPRREDPRFWI